MRTTIARYGRWRVIAALTLATPILAFAALAVPLLVRDQFPPSGTAPSIRAIHEDVWFDRSLDDFPASGPVHWEHYPISDTLRISGKADAESFRRWAAGLYRGEGGRRGRYLFGDTLKGPRDWGIGERAGDRFDAAEFGSPSRYTRAFVLEDGRFFLASMRKRR